MSVHISSAVWKDKQTTGNARMLLLALADMANDEGVCWPCVGTLRERLNVGTDRAVQQILKHLEEIGYISRDMRKGHSTIYRVHVKSIARGESPFTPEQPFTPNSDSPYPRTTVHQGGESTFTMGVNVRSPRTVIEPSLEPSIESPPTPTGGESDRGQNFDYDQDFDAFTPEELRVEPLPRPPAAADQRRERDRRNQERAALISAFRHAKYDRPLTDPIAPAEFDKCKAAADDLLAAGASPEVVIVATRAAMERWTNSSRVTLRAVAGNLTELLSPAVARAATDNDALAHRAVDRLRRNQSDPLAALDGPKRNPHAVTVKI